MSVTGLRSTTPYFPGVQNQPSENGSQSTSSTSPEIEAVNSLMTSSSIITDELTASAAQAKVLDLKPWMIDFQKLLPSLPIDPLSNAQPDEAVTTHLVWDVVPDFATKQLVATATYNYRNKAPGNDTLTLDVSNLEIENIFVDGIRTKYEIVKSEIPNKPDALRISIPANTKDGKVAIEYRTTGKSTSVYWVDKEFTEGKEHPLVYTIFQENAGASAIPGQHSPQIRLTFEVNVITDSPHLMALSSVPNNPNRRNRTGIYKDLKMERSVPLYLLSLQVGNFSFKPYSGDVRTGVYAEDSMLTEAVKAFRALPRMMKAAEEICGKYNWGMYTPVLLGWAFPHMAMEHPCASTCGRICLDNIHVIAHELAHSWAGNDITNANWQQLFWNEGLTTYLEYKITEKAWNTDFASMLFLATLRETEKAMDDYRERSPDLLKLCQETTEREFTRIPYGKGAFFFFMLEEGMGKENFSRFLKDYMKVFYQNSMSDRIFMTFLKKWVEHEMPPMDVNEFLYGKLQLGAWLYEMEIPSNKPTFRSQLVEEFKVEQQKLQAGQPVDMKKFQEWDVTVQAHFLVFLDGVTSAHLADLDTQLKLTSEKKMAIREEWARLCVKMGHLTPETTQMIVDYIIERNSASRANAFAEHLAKTSKGRAVITAILTQDRGRLLPLVRQKIEHHLQSTSGIVASAVAVPGVAADDASDS